MSEKTKLSNEDRFFMVLKAAMNVPGVKIDRTHFLKKTLKNHFSEDVVEKAIAETPARAGITVEQLEKIAKASINYETGKVSLISFAAGVPGGLAMIGTVPGDLAQYFAHIVRILQKLIYLYGWDELYDSKEDLDDETLYLLTLFIGVMFGVGTAVAAITKIAETAAVHTEKVLLRKALTKGIIYPIVKKVAAILGYRLNKQIFAKAVGKIIPIIGGFVSGGTTYLTFKVSARRLKRHLMELELADPDFYKAKRVEYVDAEFSEVKEDDELMEEEDPENNA